MEETKQGIGLRSLGVSAYTNNSSNQLTSTSAASYAYDANGNTTSKTVSGSTTTYTWDYENRLTSVVLPGTGGTVTFKYDGLGQGVQKAFTQGSTTTTTNYLYDGANPIEDLDQNGNVLARYEQTANFDEPLAELRSGAISYYQADGLGSITSLSSSAGALANTYTYDSFGNLTASTGSLTNRFQYTGRELGSETGIYNYRARYYDPSVGRFISEDSKRFEAGVNFYAYVKNDAPNFNDPSGNNPFKRWPLNGNLWPGFTGQDEVCTTGPLADIMNSRPRYKKCCKEHDDCYTKYGCNFSSFLGFLSFGPCQLCNTQVETCLLWANPFGDCKCSK